MDKVSTSASAAAPTAKYPDSLEAGLKCSQLPALDGLRAISAFLVVIAHAGHGWVPASLGVLAFFVISGFLITWLMLKEDEKYGTVSLRLFYARRALRIFPAFYVYWILIVGSRVLLAHPLNWHQAIASFFYVNNYYQAIQGDPNTALSHTWSLGIEEQFYFLWPLAFLALRKNPVRMAKALAAAIACIWIYRIVLHNAGVWQGYIYEAFDCRADHLAIGCLLAVSLRNGWFARAWRVLCSTAVLAAVTVAVLIGSTAAYLHFGTPFRDTTGFIVEAVAVAIFIPQAIAFSTTTKAWGWLNARWIRYLGRISYSTYLYQQIVPNYVEKLHLPAVVELLVVCAVVIVLASASYFLVERPFLRIKDRLGALRHNGRFGTAACKVTS